MAADLEIFKRLYLCSLTSYGLITGLADFSFTERCYWYLQRLRAHLLQRRYEFILFLIILSLYIV